MINWLANVNDKVIGFFGRIFFSTTLHVAITMFVIGIVINKVLVYLVMKYGIDISRQNLSYIGWSIFVIVCGYSLKHITVYTPGNYGQILVSGFPSLFRDKEITDSTKIERPKKQRAVFEGWSGKWPWESPVKENNPISLEKTTPLNIEMEAQSMDNITFKIKLVAAMAAIPDQNLVWHNRSDERAAVDLYRASIHAKAQMITRMGNAKDILADPTTFYKALEQMFGGDAIVERERKTGRYISKITVESAVQDDPTRKLDEAKANAGKIREILDTVIPACNDNQLLETEVARRALGAAPSENPATINVVGTESKSGKKGIKK